MNLLFKTIVIFIGIFHEPLTLDYVNDYVNDLAGFWALYIYIYAFKGVAHSKMKIYSPSDHPRYRWVCFFMGTDLEKFSIPSLAHQWVLCSEWVPSEWWTGVVWITCGLLWCWRNKLIYTLHAILGVLFILGWTMPLRQTKAFIQNNLHCIQSIHLSVQNSQCNSKGQRVENLVNL